MACWYKELSILETGNAKPQPITLSELVKKGLGANSHIVLSSYLVGSTYITYTFPGKSYYSFAWIPVYTPGEDATGRPSTFLRVSMSSQEEYLNFVQKKSVKGIVYNKIGFLRQRDVVELSPHYPGISYDNTWFIEVDRTFPTEEFVNGCWLVTLALFAIAFGCYVVSVWMRIIKRNKIV